MNLIEALTSLDPEDDGVWTAQGLPMVEAVATAMDDASVTRKKITEAAPEFTRDAHRAASTATPAPEPEPSVAPPAPVERERPGPIEDDPDAAALVEPADDVLSMDLRTVFRSGDLMDRADREVSYQSGVLHRRKAKIEEKLKQLGGISFQISRFNRRSPQSEIDRQGAAKRRAIQRSNDERRKRHERARSVFPAGTTRKEIQDVMDPRSPIDRAYAAQRGRGRPQVPVHPS